MNDPLTAFAAQAKAIRAEEISDILVYGLRWCHL